MFRQQRLLFSLALAALIPLFGCQKSEIDGVRGCFGPDCEDASDTSATLSESNGNGQATNVDIPSLVCAVTPSKDILNSGEEVTLTVKGSGGSGGSYYMPGVGSFSSQTTIKGTYTNTTSTNRIVNRTFYIFDSMGMSAACSYTVTVRPASAPVTTASGCSLTTSTTNPVTGTPTKFKLSANNSGAFTLKTLFIQTGWTETFDTAYTGDVDFTIGFTTTGARTMVATVAYNNNTYTCSVSFTVASPVTTTTPPLSE